MRDAFDDGPWPTMPPHERADAIAALSQALQKRGGEIVGALMWCTEEGFDRNHCLAKLISTTHGTSGSTKLN